MSEMVNEDNVGAVTELKRVMQARVFEIRATLADHKEQWINQKIEQPNGTRATLEAELKATESAIYILRNRLKGFYRNHPECRRERCFASALVQQLLHLGQDDFVREASAWVKDMPR